MFWSVAYAQAAGAPAKPGTLEMFLPFIFIFGIFYFLVIRPQVKRQKEHQKMVSDLKRGDAIITASGIFGTIESLSEKFVTVEIADGVVIKILRSQIMGPQNTAEGKK